MYLCQLHAHSKLTASCSDKCLFVLPAQGLATLGSAHANALRQLLDQRWPYPASWKCGLTVLLPAVYHMHIF